MDHHDDIVTSLYADYHYWCQSLGIPPERYETFYNTLKAYEKPSLHDVVQRMFTPYDIPLQPNDEQRAVAEVMRMLGGAT